MVEAIGVAYGEKEGVNAPERLDMVLFDWRDSCFLRDGFRRAF